MDIDFSEIYINNTYRFLKNILGDCYGTTFKAKFRAIHKVAYGIHDTLLDGSEIVNNHRNFFVMCNKKKRPMIYKQVIEWLQCQDYFVDMYTVGVSLNSPYVMLILRIPKLYHHAYDSFLKGEYSKMYTLAQLEKLFTVESKEYGILTKSFQAKKEFLTILKNKFDYTGQYIEGSECALPLEKEEEIFNYEKQDDRIYFNESLDKTWCKDHYI